MMFLDWQLSRYASPVLDVFFFIFSATDKSFRDRHCQNLLKLYHSTLSASIRKMGSDPEKLYSIEKFENDLKKYGPYALIFGVFIIQFCIVDQKNVMDLDEYTELLKDGKDCNLLIDFDENELFLELANDVVEDIFNYGYVE